MKVGCLVLVFFICLLILKVGSQMTVAWFVRNYYIVLTQQLVPLYLATPVLCCASVVFHRCVTFSQTFIQNNGNKEQ